jgi:octaprenyl-diphosphate synthase
VATIDRVPERTRLRVEQVQTLFAPDLVRVEEFLTASVRDGVAPATNSAEHLLTAGGKRIRPLCVLLAAASLGTVNPHAREFAAVAELVHVATLLHDDVIDDSDERRARPTARKVWGNAVSVLSGDLLLTHALERTHATGNGAALADLFTTLRSLVDGEIVQLRGRAQLDLSEATYFRIVHEKTASLFAWAGRAGARSVGATESQVQALGNYGHHVGVAFQLVDDVLDYEGDPAVTGKGLLADLAEGKVTLPLLRTLRAAPELEGDLARARAGDADAMVRVAEKVRTSEACARVRALAAAEADAAVRSVQGLPHGTARRLMEQVALEIVGRTA